MSGMKVRAGVMLALAWCAASSPSRSATPAPPAPSPAVPAAEGATRALIKVRTLVIDGMGTRTVDNDTARVPFGAKGLLVKRVPYAGPALSFRLAVTAGPPQIAGIPLTFETDVWSGDVSPMPNSSQVSHREEATVLAAEATYLLEIDHDPRADRRVMVSVSAVPIREDEALPPPPPADEAGPIQLSLQISRESAGTDTTVESHLLTTIVGRPVSYGTGVTLPPARPGEPKRHVGLTVEVNVERVQGTLMTIRVSLSGGEFVDEAKTQLVPLDHVETRTVSSGASFEVTLTAPDGPAEQNANLRPVTYRVLLTPILG